jgi:hypothetical protein
MKRLALMTGLFALVAMMVMPAALAQYTPTPTPDDEFEVVVSTPGATITVEGRRFGPGTRVTIERHRAPRGGGSAGAAGAEPVEVVETVADDNGEFAVELPAPADDEARATEIRVSGESRAGRSATVVRPLTDAPAAIAGSDVAADAHDGSLATSGLSLTFGQVFLAALAIVGGLGLLLAARARTGRT